MIELLRSKLLTHLPFFVAVNWDLRKAVAVAAVPIALGFFRRPKPAHVEPASSTRDPGSGEANV